MTSLAGEIGFVLAHVMLLPRALGSCHRTEMLHVAGLIKPEVSPGGVSVCCPFGRLCAPLHIVCVLNTVALEGRISSCIVSQLKICLPFVSLYETLTLPK